MAYLLSIVFFFGLLVALAALLESIFRTNWAAISAALRPVGAPPAAARSVRAGPGPARRHGRRAVA